MAVIDESAREYLGGQLRTARTLTGRGEEEVRVDVVLVGAGPGGLTTATVLAEAGLKVLIVEGGSYWPKGSFERKQSWALKNIYQDRGQRVMMGNAFISLQSGRGVGGGTLVNSAISFRAPDSILDEWEREHGVELWGEREARYAEVERMIGVAATAQAIAGRNSEIARRGLNKLGIKSDYMPRSAPGCVGCGTCQTGCPSGGKASADLTWLPRYLRAGGELLADTRVDSITLKGERAVGITGVTRDPQTHEALARWRVKADHVVLAAGAVNTPLLLLAQGLGNSSGQVGQNLRAHPSVGSLALFEEDVMVWWGATQGYYAHHPEEPEILLETFSLSPDLAVAQAGGVGGETLDFLRQFKKIAACGLLIRDRSKGHITYNKGRAPSFHYTLLEVDRVKMTRGLMLIAEMFFAAGARGVKPMLAGAHFIRSYAQARAFIDSVQDPSAMQLYASHPMGTCRMSADPSRGVVRPEDGRTHDIEGLYVTDSSLFPSALGVNPQMTIMAQSLELADRMVAAWS